jgi:ubiquinone/menaquinone biosynthesis C-methylase UbiE
MIDIDLYEQSTDKYEDLQRRRPDYVGAEKALIDLASIHIKKKDIVVADFCCGIGNSSRDVSKIFPIKKLTLIDINKQFLNIALNSRINASNIVPIQSDILKVSLHKENDIVISMFAYHHVRDDDKAKYIEIVKNALVNNGKLFMGEIYSPDKQTTLAYYEHLLEDIPVNIRTPELETFLRQTARSEDFEYKVSKKFAHDQLITFGFKLLDSVKIWPKDNAFHSDVGTFVEVWGLKG